jgi:[FeFe] hydrogenase H-cluster maturation GTPase HydF
MLIDRDNIGIFGRMNVGKSSVMNLLTQQITSIVDSTPGTTADTKTTLQEIHGLGPVKLFDTAGYDETDQLGEKKRLKIISDLKECDLVLLVIDPSKEYLDTEDKILKNARELNKQILIVYNLFEDENNADDKIKLLKFYKKIRIKANDENYRQELLNFILENFESKNKKIELLPFIEKDEFYVLNIPMDIETPTGRYLRPQAMVDEFITRNWAYPSCYRMDLVKIRQGDETEIMRFHSYLESFKKRPKAIITDSQAMDIMHKLVPEDIMLTTFSIVMINYVSKGRLNEFVEGVKMLDSLVVGDKILIVEACNHSRIGEDIGTKQIPEYMSQKYPGVVVQHNFGREFQENNKLMEYKLIIHCGGCMISSQKIAARLRDLNSLGIPYTNYGVFLSYIQGALDRVIEPWLDN